MLTLYFDMKDTKPYAKDLDEALAVLRRGGIILYPTDTVWGIGCDATDAEAVARIYTLKRRAESKSMIVLVPSTDNFGLYSDSVADVAYDLAELSERPCTLVLDGAIGLAPNLVAEDGSVGMRATCDDFSRDLCRLLRHPLVSTSANLSGEKTAACFQDINPEIIAGVDYVVEWRRDDVTPAKPSTVIKIKEDGEFTILRS